MEIAEDGTTAAMDAGGGHDDHDKEVELMWAAIERLPSMKRWRTGLLDDDDSNINGGEEEISRRPRRRKVVDVVKLSDGDRRRLIDELIKSVEEDNLCFLKKLRDRIDRVGLRLPTIEVRYQNLSVESECKVVDGKPLPTVWNTVKGFLNDVTGYNSEIDSISILKDVNGIIKPSRLTLLLGPPGCGKTTFLQALSGLHNRSVKVRGEISYNGYKLSDFIPQNTSAYISQYDVHTSEMTARETLDFSARCQGIGNRADILKAVSKMEKQAGIIPDPGIDTYMKAISIQGLKRTLHTDYILKILGLDICADTIVGDAMRCGIYGGQKRRLTTGEMIIGPTRALFMDEISNGLDSSTAFQIITCLQQTTHILDATVLIALLQPAPETFELFDDLVLMAEGKVVYHGPRCDVQHFFEHCGFRCPHRKGVADFLQEVLSEKDQAQYWYHKDKPYCYVPVDKFITAFKEYHTGQHLNQELSTPFKKTDIHKSALSFKIYSVGKRELLAACMSKEWLLMKRNAFIHVFKSAQLVVVALVTATVFIRTRMKIDIVHASYYMGALFYALNRLMSNGIAELSLTVQRLPVFYKQRDFYFYPAWAYSIPAAILKTPFLLLDAFLWTALTYYGIGYSPEPVRFFQQLLILFLVNQVAVSIFRVIAATVRNPPVATTIGIFSLLLIFLFGGFVIPRPSLPSWIEWGFWLSPLTYAEIGISVNEFLAPRWQKKDSHSNVTLGQQVLTTRGLNYGADFYWISVAALVGFWILLNIGFTIALTYMKPPGKSHVMISDENFSYLKGTKNPSEATQGEVQPHIECSEARMKTGMVLPCKHIAVTFKDVKYFVDTPKRLRKQGVTEKRLQLLHDITGTFRPGILTVLMGVSGAGKTTLMDVLSGRKTSGTIEGEIRVGGYPKVQETYTRISVYCEQSDIHSPHITEFAAEVLEMIELDRIKDALVGLPGVSGISPEQRKRLTLAVELVSNPSIVFMDEPTTGLDARAAAIVMRAVKNIVATNRTIVCTIHQPSIDIFEAFDELILMKRGGQIIYSGELGNHSNKLIECFEGITGVLKIKENYNPSTWMLEATCSTQEAKLGIDFACIYKESHLYKRNKELVDELSRPSQNLEEPRFSTRYPLNGWEQLKTCLWKQHVSYLRTPTYILARFLFIVTSSLLYAALLWKKGRKMDNEQDFLGIMGSLYVIMTFTGISSSASVIPFVATQRIILYRERFAGMYSSWIHSLSQVIIEIPYIFVEATFITTITYPVVDFHASVYKVFWYFYTMFCTLLYYKYLGMMFVSMTSTYQVAAVFSSFFNTFLGLFSGFIIPGPKIPKWWIWCYWICPSSWSLKGLLTSQYGDLDKGLVAFGEHTTVKAFLDRHFWYNYDKLPSVAIVLFTFPLLFALCFAYCIDKLNFQRR